jgi:mannan endo-1,4-beta-mannosidase
MERRLLLAIVLFGATALAALVVTYRLRQPDMPELRSDFVYAKDGRLELHGERYRFFGVNVYSMLSDSHHRRGFVCGKAWTRAKRDKAMREIRSFGGTVIRLPVYQPYTDSASDFRILDETIALAERHGIRLILVLEGQWGHCSTGEYITPAWYRGGYRSPYDKHRLSYVEYARRIVTRYKDEPTILAWQLMNEAEASSGAIAVGVPDPEALYMFARDMSAEIRRIDPNHLISLGTIDDSRAGMGTVDYANVLQLSTVDLAEGHDYEALQPFPMAMRRCRKIAELAKVPFMIGEVGVSTEEFVPEDRARYLVEKLEAAWDADVDGLLIWSYAAGDGGGFDIAPGDPVIPELRQFARDRGLLPK